MLHADTGIWAQEPVCNFTVNTQSASKLPRLVLEVVWAMAQAVRVASMLALVSPSPTLVSPLPTHGGDRGSKASALP